MKYTFDAQAALGFVQSQTGHIEQAVNETVYPDIQYAALIPVDSTAHPFTQTITYYSSDMVGKADWINGNADDMPTADNEMAEHKTSVYTAGIGYNFGWEEVNVAMMLGRPLEADKARSARRSYEEMVDGVAMRGDARKGFSGLIDYPGITAVSAENGAWDDVGTTEDEMLEDINLAIMGVATDTLYTSMADTVLLPWPKLDKISRTRLGDTQMTVLEFLRRNNSYTATTGQPLDIRAVRGLETAGAGSTARLAAYRRSPDVLKLHIPMPHRFLPVWQAGPLRWEVPGVFRLGGLDIRRKKEVRYVDGI